MKGKLILLLLLVTTALESEGVSLDGVGESIKGTLGDAKDGITGAAGDAKDTLTNFWNNLKEKTNSAFGNIKDDGIKKLMSVLPDNVKNWISKGDFSNANVTELLEKTPPQVWNAMKPERLKTLGREKLDKLLKDGGDKLPARVRSELERIRASNMTKKESIAYLKENKDKIKMMKASELNTLKMKLGAPANFNKVDVTEMKDFILTIPPGQLLKVKDANARAAIESNLEKCQTGASDKPTYCPPNPERLLQALQMKSLGSSTKWTNETLADMSTEQLLALPIPVIKKIKPNVLISKFDDLVSYTPEADDLRGTKKGLVLAKNLLKGHGITMKESKTAVEVNAVYDRMGRLSKYVLPSFVPAAALEEDEVLSGKLMDNAEMMASNGEIDPKECRKAFKDAMKDWTVTNITEDQLRKMGGLLAQAPPSVLMNLTKSNQLANPETLIKVANGLQSAKGPGFRSKARTVLRALKSTNWGAVDQIPVELVEMVPASTIQSMTENNIKTMLKRGPKLTDEQKNVILSKISVDRLAEEPAVILNRIPITDVTSKDATVLKRLAKNLPQGSPMIRMAVSKELDKRKDSSVLMAKDLNDYDSVVLKNLGPKHIDMIDKSNITDVLKKLQMDGQPSMDTCRALKEKLSKYSQDSLGADDDMEALEMLNTADIENTPPCVIAAFGKEAVMKKLGNVEKEILLKNMANLDDISTIAKADRTTIVQEGLKAMASDTSLSEMDLEELKNAAPDLDASHLKKLSEEGKFMMINYLNMAAMKHMKPCLDSSQRDAIKGMLLDIKGDASKWTTTDDVSCLLDTLPEGTLNQIPTEVMAQWSCDRNIQGYEDYVANREAQCKYDIGEKEFKNVNDNMKMVEMKALQAALKNLDTSSSQMRRRKRQATSESGAAMCDKAAIGGGNSLETNEIKNMASEDVMSCLADLGQAEITQEKAKALAEKVYMAKSKNLDLTSDEIQSLGYILRGFTADQIMNFSVPTTSSDIAALGIERDLTQEQLTALAKKVKEWKAVENLSSDELKNVNKIVCGFSAAEVEKLKTDSIMKALPTLRDLDDCSSNVTMKLANKAFMKYNETGKITDAMVAELGGLVGNLAPEYINKIPADAMAGLTVKGMESFTPDAIKSMNIDQIKALPVAAAKALTSNQQSHFNEDMKEALKNGPLKDPNVETKDSGANSFIGSAVLCAFGVSAALQLL